MAAGAISDGRDDRAMTAMTTEPVKEIRADARGTLLDTLRSFLDEIGGAPVPVTPAADLERDLGLGSLERAELMSRLEQALAIRLPDSTLAESQTVGSLLRLAESSAGDEPATFEASAGARQLPEQARTLVEVARFRAEADGGRRHLLLLDDDGESSMTFGELWDQALQVGSGLRALGLRPEDRVALMLGAGADFFTAFLGVLCAGGVPVPLEPPGKTGLGADLRRRRRLLDDARPAVLVVDRQLLMVGQSLAERTAGSPPVATVDSLARGPKEGYVRAEPDGLALIQHASEGGGDARGVALTHRAILANVRALGRELDLSPEGAVDGPPLSHDMGLIAGWWTALYHGLPLVVSPAPRDPSRAGWLETAAVAVPALRRRALDGIRAAGRTAFGVYAVLAALPVALVGATIMLLACRSQSASWKVARGFLRLWGRLTGLLPRASGGELPPGGAILVSNHGSYLDPLLLIMAVERPIRFTSKREVFSLPIVRNLMRQMRHLSVDRSTAALRLEGYQVMAAALQEGHLVHVFPEGTFTRKPGVRPLRLGAFYLAAELGRPVVPVVLRGARRALPDERWLLQPSRIEVETLDPLTVEAGAGFRELAQTRDRVRGVLSRGSREPLLEGMVAGGIGPPPMPSPEARA